MACKFQERYKDIEVWEAKWPVTSLAIFVFGRIVDVKSTNTMVWSGITREEHIYKYYTQHVPPDKRWKRIEGPEAIEIIREALTLL